MKGHEMAHKIQLTLNNALNYWLYGSISGYTLRNRFYSARFISTHYLRDLAKMTGRSLIQNTVPVKLYAEVLADFYEYWQNNMPCSVKASKIPTESIYEKWLQKGGKNDCYLPVHLLKDLLLRKTSNKFFLTGIVHGSIATLDDMPEFSDMDLAFVVKASALKDSANLLELRSLATEILTLSYYFDPFMHHGPYYISEIDLSWYPEAMFPTVLFGYGVDLLDESQEIKAYTRPSNDVTDQMLNMFEEFFKKWPTDPFVLKDSYDIEWILGSTMLLPALYLQSLTGEFRYKLDTFALSEKDFLSDEWEPVRTATYLRSNLSSRYKVSPSLVWLARHLQWPGLVQSVARRSKESVKRAQETAKILGPDYPLRVLRLLKAMKQKLRNN